MSEIRLAHLHEAQLKVVRTDARVKVLCCGRQWGKTTLSASELILHALVRAEPCWWVYPTDRNANQAWRELMRILRPVEGVAIYKDDRLIEFDNGGWIQVVSSYTPQNLRGANLGFAVLDEAAYMENDFWPTVVQPMLVKRDAPAMIISTPNGFNWFYDEYMRGMRGEDGYAAFHFTSYDNPLLPPHALDRLRATMSAKRFAQEIMAEFVSDALSVFREVEAVLQGDVELSPLDNSTYVMGVDWGRKTDYTAISVWNATEAREVELARFNDVGFDRQSHEIQLLAEKWSVNLIVAEETGMGLAATERLQSMGLPVIPFRMTYASKRPLIEAFALAIEKREVTLLPDPVGLQELRAYTEQQNPRTGMISYSAPSGAHDDTVIARALAYSQVGVPMGDIVVLEW